MCVKLKVSEIPAHNYSNSVYYCICLSQSLYNSHLFNIRNGSESLAFLNLYLLESRSVESLRHDAPSHIELTTIKQHPHLTRLLHICLLDSDQLYCLSLYC